MSAASVPLHRTATPSRALRAALFGMLALCVFGATLAALARQPVLALDRARGFYAVEGDELAFRWTGSLAEIPLAAHGGPTRLDLVLGIAGWPREPSVPVRIETDAGLIGTFAVTPQPRHVQTLLPPGATTVRLRTLAAQAPGEDWRWLGVQLFSAAATPSGLPLHGLTLAALAALASVLLAAGMAWAAPRGYGPIFALTLAGLALRLLWLADSPPLAHRDEIVSLVDAWSLSRTGRDHLGHLLPLAAFEAYGDWISPMLTYLLLPWVALFGPQPLVGRVVAAVFGALAIPAIYALARELRMPPAARWAAGVAALSPWQIFLSRASIPPALVATCWTLCLWAAVRFVARGRRRDAFWLAGAVGLAIYAYPTLKLAVPLLVALALALALARHGWRAAWGWWPAAPLLGLLWLPLAASTLFNPASGSRLQLVALKADSAGAWLAAWWNNYAVYFQPSFYYLDGGVRKIVQGLPDHGVALSAEAFLLLGLLAFPLIVALERRAAEAQERVVARVPAQVWLLLAGALLIAPLPASLTAGNPHTFRGSPVAPLYALLVGLGAALWWRLAELLAPRARPLARAGAAALAIAIAWQCGAWYTSLIRDYPSMATATWYFADGESDAMRELVALAPKYDEVWLDVGSVGRPYIFLLAAQALLPADAQARIEVVRNPPQINEVTRIGRYHFVDFKKLNVPWTLPALEALPTRDGGPGYLIQELRRDGRRVLTLRGMTTQAQNYADGGDSN